MKQLLQLASEIQSFCENQKWRFCFIGGIALLRWGEPRLTVDVDLSLFTGFGDEARFVKALGSTFDHRIKDVYAFALRHRVLLLNGLLPKSKPTHNSHDPPSSRIVNSGSYRLLQAAEIHEKHKWPVWATARSFLTNEFMAKG